MSRIFVSHSNKDQKNAKSLGSWLKAQGHSSYFLDIDPDKGIAPGKHWEDELYKHLRLCRAVIALVSPNWLESRWCFAEVTQARAAGKPIFFAKIADCHADEIFTDVQHVDLTIDSALGYQRLARSLKEIGIDPGETFEWDPSRPPYPGLLAFEEKDAAMFFGRDRDIQKGLETLEGLRLKGEASFILCLGASGSGKSSLVRAGLIPRLRKNQEAWLPIAPFRPQENPLEELAIKLAETFTKLGEPRSWNSVFERLYTPYTGQDSTNTLNNQTIPGKGLKDIIRDLCILVGNSDATVLLTIDQTEELFGNNEQKSRAFIQCIRGALEMSSHRLMIIATMRSDTFGSFQTHSDLQNFAYQLLTIDPIPLQDLPPIIEGPAQRADITLEAGLVQMLVQDAKTEDALPLLAFTLRELYERYGQDRQLLIKEYNDLGRLEGSIRRAADSVINTFQPNPEELAALRMAFVPAMVRVNEESDFIRRRATWLDLPARAYTLLQRFIDARLLVSSGKGGERIIEIAHEALLRAWPRLSEWLREDSDNLRLLDDLRRAGDKWESNSKDKSWLVHHGERLEAVENMLHVPQFGEQLEQIAKDYFKACIERRRAEQKLAELQTLTEHKRLEAEAKTARRTRNFAFALAIIAVIAIGAAIFGWMQKDIAEGQRTQALISQSKALSYVSRQQTDKKLTTLGILLALEALPKQDSQNQRPFVPEAEAALLYGLFDQREKHILSGHTNAVNKVRFSPQGSLIVTASRDGTAKLWNAVTGKATSTLKGHDSQVYWAEFSPDNKRVVTASSDKTAQLWAVENGEMIGILEDHKGDVYQATFSPDGKSVVTASSDNTARLWTVSTGETIIILKGHKGVVYQAAFSPNGKRLVTASSDKTVRLWNTETGMTIATLTSHGDKVIKATFSPNGQRIVTASWDHTARLWNGFTGEIIATMQGHKDGINYAEFSPDGKWVITTSADKTARIWNAVTGRSIAVLDGHKGMVHDAQFSADSQRLVTTSADKTVRLWDVATGKTIHIYNGHIGRVWSADISPDNRQLVTASQDNTARIWQVESNITNVELQSHKNRVHKAIFSPDGSKLATVSEDKTARLWDGNTGDEIIQLVGHEGAVWYAAFSQNGERLVTTSTDGTAIIWDTSTGSLIHTLRGHKGLVIHAQFSPNGLQVVTGGQEGSARLWDVATGNHLATLSGHLKAVNFVEFSHDGLRIVTASQDSTARLWKLASSAPELITVLHGHTGPIINGAFSPDDKWIVTASWDKTARIWDTNNGCVVAVLDGHKDVILSAEFSPNSQQIITGSADNTAQIWDAISGKPMHALLGHTNEVINASFSSDGRLIITASRDGTARLWHTASGLSVATLKGHRDDVVSASFAPDGQHLATASLDGTAKLWKLPIGNETNWIKYAMDNVPRGLTPNERSLYVGK